MANYQPKPILIDEKTGLTKYALMAALDKLPNDTHIVLDVPETTEYMNDARHFDEAICRGDSDGVNHGDFSADFDSIEFGWLPSGVVALTAKRRIIRT